MSTVWQRRCASLRAACAALHVPTSSSQHQLQLGTLQIGPPNQRHKKSTSAVGSAVLSLPPHDAITATGHLAARASSTRRWPLLLLLLLLLLRHPHSTHQPLLVPPPLLRHPHSTRQQPQPLLAQLQRHPRSSSPLRNHHHHHRHTSSRPLPMAPPSLPSPPTQDHRTTLMGTSRNAVARLLRC
jgi:hypothetical protein